MAVINICLTCYMIFSVQAADELGQVSVSPGDGGGGDGGGGGGGGG